MGDANDNTVHVALAANHRYARGLFATFASMVDAASEKRRLRFHVFDIGLAPEDRDALAALGRRLGYGGTIDFRVPDMEPLERDFDSFHGSHIPVLRLFFPELLPELDWVLWSDVDVLWFRDPAKLWAERDGEVSLLWSRDIPSTRKWAKKTARWRPDMDESRYACSGVVLMNLERMRRLGFVEKCIGFVRKWGTPMFADQGVLNEICYDDSRFVDDAWDCLYPVDDVKSGLVVHFNCIGYLFDGGRFRGIFPLFEIWFRYYEDVVEGKGGSVVAAWWKRCLWNLAALLYPFRKPIAFATDRIHPWVSDFIQRFIFFSWLRRKKLW